MLDLYFNLIGLSVVLASLGVVLSINPVDSVLFLILVFVLSSMLLILLNHEFLALIFIVVYVGAVAVLFLFVVMMLNVRLVEIEESLAYYLPVGGLVGLVFVLEFYGVLSSSFVSSDEGLEYFNWSTVSGLNIEILGSVIYTYHCVAFVLCGFVLLAAMIGSIFLTEGGNQLAKRQEIYEQVGRDYKKVIKLYK